MQAYIQQNQFDAHVWYCCKEYTMYASIHAFKSEYIVLYISCYSIEITLFLHLFCNYYVLNFNHFDDSLFMCIYNLFIYFAFN